MMLYKICTYFLIFTVFSVAGWITETLLYLIRDGKAVKRGFLFGPVCPIYGVAAILCDLLIYRIMDNIIYIFLAGFLLTGVLEYMTHFVMEKVFKAMWWDYSDRRFNINGRVYLKGLIFFGIGAVLIVRVFLPLLYQLFDIMPDTLVYVISFVVYSIFLFDLATTIADLKDTVRALKHFELTVAETMQKGINLTTEQFDSLKKTITESETYRRAIKENSTFIEFKRKHPGFTFKRYSYILDIISDRPKKQKGKKGIKLYGTADSLPGKNEEEKSKENKDGGKEDIV